MAEFWETQFDEKGEMWGYQPARSALVARDCFIQQGVKKVLIPGIGYGRNAQVFMDCGMNVTGIEISVTAIDLAGKHFDGNLKIHHGSVVDMPFDKELYDGIFCYALIHLLDRGERKKLIEDCYAQLQEEGYMIFTAITTEADTFGQGRYISEKRYEIHKGVKMYFYDRISVHEEFHDHGLFEIAEIEEHFPFYLIKCQK